MNLKLQEQLSEIEAYFRTTGRVLVQKVVATVLKAEESKRGKPTPKQKKPTTRPRQPSSPLPPPPAPSLPVQPSQILVLVPVPVEIVGIINYVPG